MGYTAKSRLALLGGVMVHLVLGSFYLWPNVVVYITSYFRALGNPTLTIAQANFVFPAMILAQCVAMPFGMQMGKWMGFKLMLFLGNLIIAASIFVASFMTNFWTFIIFYGFTFGMANGALYVVPMKIGFLYYPHRKGMVSGTIVAGFGMGSFIWSYVALYLINPQILKPEIHNSIAREHYFDHRVADNVPFGIQILSLCYLILSFAGSSLIDVPTEDKVKEYEQALCGKDSEALITKPHCPKVLVGIKSLILYQLVLFTWLGSSYGAMLVPNIKNYGRKFHTNDKTLTTCAAMGSLFNGLLRICWGLLMDKVPYKVLILCNLIIQLLMVSTIQLVAHDAVLYGIYVTISYVCFGGFFAIQPTITVRIFGHGVGTVVYGIVFLGFAFGSLTQFFFVKWAVPRYNWPFVFDFYIGVVVFAILCAIVFKFQRDWTREDEEYKKLQQEDTAKVQA